MYSSVNLSSGEISDVTTALERCEQRLRFCHTGCDAAQHRTWRHASPLRFHTKSGAVRHAAVPCGAGSGVRGPLDSCWSWRRTFAAEDEHWGRATDAATSVHCNINHQFDVHSSWCDAADELHNRLEIPKNLNGSSAMKWLAARSIR